MGPEEAWRLLDAEAECFDLVVCDDLMPGLTGTELAARLLDRRADLPVLLMTGWSRDRPRPPNVRRVEPKPMSMRRLATIVRRLLDDPTGVRPL
jgi:CheY-like chemotaxis protein